MYKNNVTTSNQTSFCVCLLTIKKKHILNRKKNPASEEIPTYVQVTLNCGIEILCLKNDMALCLKVSCIVEASKKRG